MSEKFRPVSNTRDDSFIGKLKFYGRMLLDLQILTIYKDIKREIPAYKGNVLDVGCGQSPYRFLLDEKAVTYSGIDILDAEKFDYNNSETIHFNGEDIPFEDNKFDHVICTEVLEHVFGYQQLVDEMYRVMKPGATGIVTIPWSARFHYAPWDYFRYTPSALKNIFSKFSEANVHHRGNDVAAIGNKTIVLFFRNLIPNQLWRIILVPFWIAFLPLLSFIALAAQWR